MTRRACLLVASGDRIVTRPSFGGGGTDWSVRITIAVTE